MDPTNLFTILGRYVKGVDELDAVHATLDTRRDDIASEHNSSGSLGTIDGLHNAYDRMHGDIRAAITRLIQQATDVLTDYDLVVSNLPIPKGSGIQTVLEALYRDMVVEEYYVSPTNPTRTASDPDPSDTGFIRGFLTLDGFNAPGNRARAFLDWSGQETQLINLSETLTFRCTRDSYSNGLAVDAEQFSVTSNYTNLPYSGFNEGSGLVATMNAVGASNLVSPAARYFGTYDSSTGFTGWTTDTGTEETDFTQETGTTNTFRNSSALKLLDAGTQVILQHSIPTSRFTPNRAYIIGFWCKASGNESDEIILRLKDGSTTLGSINNGSTSTYESTGNNALVVLPETLTATNLTLELDCDPSGPNFEEDHYIGGVYCVPAQYFAGLPFAVIPTLTPFALGDNLQLALTNDLESSLGRFQRFFRRAYNFQLPVSGSTLLPDTLITG